MLSRLISLRQWNTIMGSAPRHLFLFHFVCAGSTRGDNNCPAIKTEACARAADMSQRLNSRRKCSRCFLFGIGATWTRCCEGNHSRRCWILIASWLHLITSSIEKYWGVVSLAALLLSNNIRKSCKRNGHSTYHCYENLEWYVCYNCSSLKWFSYFFSHLLSGEVSIKMLIN